MLRLRQTVENLGMNNRLVKVTMRNAIGFLLVAAVVCGLSQTDLLPKGQLLMSPGEAAVSQEVTDIDYVADDADGKMLSEVRFTILPAPSDDSEVTVRLNPKGAWYSCSSQGTEVVCPTDASPISLEDVVEMQVVAD